MAIAEAAHLTPQAVRPAALTVKAAICTRDVRVALW